jgi:multiple sugar transport system permease protein
MEDTVVRGLRAGRIMKRVRRALFYLVVLLIVVVSLAPFIWQIISSISSERELLMRPPNWIPEAPTFFRYIALLGFSGAETQLEPAIINAARNFRGAFANSVIIATTTTLLTLVVGTPAAYAYTRLVFPGRRYLFFGILATRMIPPISIVIPLFLAIRTFGLMDTKLALIITYTSMMLPLVVWIMSAFFRSVPWEIEESAMIDGCSRMKALVLVILPLSMPGMVAAGVIAFLFAWNEFFYALIFTNSLASKTLPKAISEFSSAMGAGLDYGMVMTGGVITSLVPVAIALFFQRYLVRGLTGGSVKG